MLFLWTIESDSYCFLHTVFLSLFGFLYSSLCGLYGSYFRHKKVPLHCHYREVNLLFNKIAAKFFFLIFAFTLYAAVVFAGEGKMRYFCSRRNFQRQSIRSVYDQKNAMQMVYFSCEYTIFTYQPILWIVAIPVSVVVLSSGLDNKHFRPFSREKFQLVEFCSFDKPVLLLGS